MLMFKSVSIEDMGEIKFTAEKASSTAKLKVKGKVEPDCWIICIMCIFTCAFVL